MGAEDTADQIRRLRERERAPSLGRSSRQSLVDKWARRVLGAATFANSIERALRVAEEAVEFAQAIGVDVATVRKLVDYVYARPVGLAEQEIGGILVTVYAAAACIGVDAEEAVDVEIARIHTPEIEAKVQRRQDEKRENDVAVTVEGDRDFGEARLQPGDWPPRCDKCKAVLLKKAAVVLSPPLKVAGVLGLEGVKVDATAKYHVCSECWFQLIFWLTSAVDKNFDGVEGFIRASGDCICPKCERPYWRHHDSHHRDWNGEPFLKHLCDGTLVKL
jgi:hypothetical protein